MLHTCLVNLLINEIRDWNTGRDIGCREESLLSELNIPWFFLNNPLPYITMRLFSLILDLDWDQHIPFLRRFEYVFLWFTSSAYVYLADSWAIFWWKQRLSSVWKKLDCWLFVVSVIQLMRYFGSLNLDIFSSFSLFPRILRRQIIVTTHLYVLVLKGS